MIYKQIDIYSYLLNNPYNVAVNVGSLDNLNGNDYIFLDYITDNLIGSDNKGVYRTVIQITVASRNFEICKSLTKYVRDFLNVSITYEKSDEFEYYLARCECGILMCEEQVSA